MNSMNSMNSSTSYSNYQSNTTTNKPYQQQQSQPYLNGTMPPSTRPNGAIPSGNGSNGGGNGTNPSDPSMFYYSPPHNQQNSQANRMPPQQQINGWGDFWWSAWICISACFEWSLEFFLPNSRLRSLLLIWISSFIHSNFTFSFHLPAPRFPHCISVVTSHITTHAFVHSH